MSNTRDLLDSATIRAASYLHGLDARGVAPSREAASVRRNPSDYPPELSRRVSDLQADGTCWCGDTVWQGKSAMRISVSSWATTEDDVERSLAAMIRVASAAGAPAARKP